MKYYFKLFMLLPVGLFTAIIIYPFLHELSHSMCAIAFGANVVNFSLFPLPSVVCSFETMSNARMFFIAISGTIIPLLLCIAVRSKIFWINYIKILIIVISILSFLISIFGFIFAPEILLNQDDLVRFSALITGGNVVSLAICIIGIFISFLILLKTLKKCEFFSYFQN
ncbi:hypothetical protein [uncultured Eubacterium sp.]|uniref:hypothetical protein n=1 Tax=uncultured Eubacterium sp. TaxID=165185 RepID=UPI0025E48D4B|nr:hypothetical protein [uncultured Eubacterium sp.]